MKNNKSIGLATTKKTYIELLRCFAIFFVIYIHTGISAYQNYTSLDNTFLYILNMALAIISKIAVPIFFMISGALLLNKEEDIKTLFKKRILRILIVLICSSFIQYLFLIRKDFSQFNILKFFKTIYTDNIIVPYWFLYSYLVFLLILPFLRNMVKNMKKEHFIYLIILSMVITVVIPIINLATNTKLNVNLNIPLITNVCILYPILGYYCEHILDIEKINKAKLFKGLGISILLIALAEILTTIAMKKTGDNYTQDYLVVGAPFITMYFYTLIKYWCKQKSFSKFTVKIINILGGCSFGIYLTEQLGRALVFEKVISFSSPYIGTYFSSLIAIFIVLIICTILISILKKIPYVGKLL